jgi:hypothetical protein
MHWTAVGSEDFRFTVSDLKELKESLGAHIAFRSSLYPYPSNAANLLVIQVEVVKN